MTLKERILKCAETTDSLTWEEEDGLHELDRASLRGQYLENARLRPLIEALAESAANVEMFNRKFSPGDDWYPEMRAALTVLTKVIEEMEK